MVATPIGNLEDLSPRARRILRDAELVVCEDSRVTGKLMNLIGERASLVPYHDHNAEKIRPSLLGKLKAGAVMALVSDAGTPCIADPGFKLVRAAHEHAINVFSIPGPSAAIAALSIAGLPTNRFFFNGFPPVSTTKRRRLLSRLADIPGTLIFFESANRLPAFLDDCAHVLGVREAAISREITKLHEEILRGTLQELAELLNSRDPLKGEIVLLIGPPSEPEITNEELDHWILEALQEASPSTAAAAVAARSGRPRKDIYRRALELRHENAALD